ncbi:MAG: nitroreductase family protein [Bacilli bacterium]
MEFSDVIRKRTSVRSFNNIKVEKEKLNKILFSGRLSPTAKNNQPQYIYVIESDEGLAKIDKITPCRYNASTCLLVCSDKDKAFKMDNYSSYEMDATIVATHMMLEATNQGVDNIWIRMFDRDKVKEIFNLSDSLEPICILNLGYKTSDYTVSPNYGKRKDISEMVEYL